jgi:hypothetical protein
MSGKPIILPPKVRRRMRLMAAMRLAEREIKGTHARQNRQEWAESRKREGWGSVLVDDAVGAGSLRRVREAIVDHAESNPKTPTHLLRAMAALGVIDTQRMLETPREHGLTPHRSRSMPPRLRALPGP